MSIQVGYCRCRLCENGCLQMRSCISDHNSISALQFISRGWSLPPHLDLRRTRKHMPSSWETTAALVQMFLTSAAAMNVFTDTRGHDRLALIYRPYTIEEEVTFSEEEDVSAEKGREEDVVFVHEPSLQRACYWLDVSSAPYMGSVGFGVVSHQVWKCSLNVRNCQKFCRAGVTHSLNDFFTRLDVQPGSINSTEWCMMCRWELEYRCFGGGGVCRGRRAGCFFFYRGEEPLWMEGTHSFSLKFLLSVNAHVPIVLLPSIQETYLCVCVCACVPGVTQLYCTISVIHLFICHRCYHGYYRLTAVFSLRRTQVRCGRGDKVNAWRMDVSVCQWVWRNVSGGSFLVLLKWWVSGGRSDHFGQLMMFA